MNPLQTAEDVRIEVGSEKGEGHPDAVPRQEGLGSQIFRI
jgi:hypothetical protein